MRLLFGLVLAGILCAAAGVVAAEEPVPVAFATLGSLVVHGNEADNLLLGAGAFDLRDDPSPAGTIEYRFGRKVFIAGFSLGLVANTKGGLFGYAGLYSDWSYRKLYLTPQIAMGGYHQSNSSNLGGVFQFRLSMDLTYRFDSGHRLGIRAAHISNANIHNDNPGEEELLLIYSFPLGPYL